MQRWTDLEQIPSGFGPSVVTLGNFDGVHRGHRAVLDVVIAQARRRASAAVAVTFDPHPVAVLHPDRAPVALTGMSHRLQLLEGVGLDAAVVLPFTLELARQTPEEFVTRVFVEALGACAVVVGEDTRFGVHNSGDVSTMRALGDQHGFAVLVQHAVGEASDGARQWSSSRVRAAIAAGDVVTASEVLGRPHRVCGTVVHGRHRGRDLGYPTANLGTDSTGMVPADGVYAGWMERPDLPVTHDDRRLPAAISVGTNPTFDDVPVRTVEAYVLDRDDLALYDEQVCIDLVQRLRGNVRFESVEELLTQMARDVAVSRAVLLG